MANISYTSTFHHHPWRDRVDRVEAGGPNGFNGRFAAIQSDLTQVSTVVTQIGSALDQIDRVQHVLAFTPTLHPVRDTSGASVTSDWSVSNVGAPQVTLGDAVQAAQGLVNLDLPHGAVLTSLRARGQFTGTANASGSIVLTVALSGVSLTPVVPSSSLDPIVTTGIDENQRIGAFDTTDPADETKARVDLDNLRYLLSVAAHATQPDGLIVTLETIEITYLA